MGQPAKREEIASNPFLVGVDTDCLRPYLGRVHWCYLPAGDTLLPPGASIKHLFYIDSGCLALLLKPAHSPAGWVEILGPGELLHLTPILAGRDFVPGEVVAVSDARLLQCPADCARRIVEQGGELARRATQYLAGRSLDLAERVLQRQYLTRLGRVAQSLVSLSECLNSPVLSVSHATLASISGTDRTGATRELRRLRDLGLVETGRNRVIILDPAGLLGIVSLRDATPPDEVPPPGA